MTELLDIKRSRCTPAQWRALSSQSKSVLVSGGFGAGKTQTIALKALQLKTINPHVPGLIVSQTWSSLWSITVRRLLSIICRNIPREKWPRIKDKTGECYLDFGDGVPIFLRSASNPSTIDGLDVGWAIGDELRHWPRESFEVLMGRVRVKCQLNQTVFASTPAMNFMMEEFNSGKENRELIIAPTKENEKNLAPGFIDNLRLSYSKRLQRAVIDGEFTILEGAVFESFDPNPAIVGNPWFVDYDWRKFPNRKTYLAVDPGFRKSAWLFIHEVSPIEWIVFDELMPENTSTQICVQMINAKNIPVDEVWSDPAADNTQGAINIDDAVILRGVRGRGGPQPPIRYLSDRFRSIEYGVEKVRFLLGDPSANMPVRVSFARTLAEKKFHRGIVRDLASLRYPDLKDGRPISNKPVKDGVTDHSTDACRYWAVGMVLTSPLRKMFYDLQSEKGGFRLASAA